jgi:hypothetical protein
VYYLDMGSAGAEIGSFTKSKIVGQYVIYRGAELPGQMAYRAHTIVTLTANGSMQWHKNRHRPELALLTKDEQEAMVLQILKSEVW